MNSNADRSTTRGSREGNDAKYTCRTRGEEGGNRQSQSSRQRPASGLKGGYRNVRVEPDWWMATAEERRGFEFLCNICRVVDICCTVSNE